MESTELLIDTSIIIEHLRKGDKRRSILFNIPETTDLFILMVLTCLIFKGADPTWIAG